MLEERVYKLSELKSLIKESDSKPVLGKGVESADKQNNTKAVDDIMKQVKKYNDVSDTSKERKTNPENVLDQNKTTLDANFAYEPSDEYKERVKAQAHGFASKEHEENSDKDDSVDYEGNKKFYDADAKKTKEQNEKAADIKHAGLKSHNLDKENFKNKSAFKNESKTMKRLFFKNTTFLNEKQMLSKVPDDYKTDGNKFVMKDASGNEYLVECKVDDRFNFTQLNVLNKMNKEQVNEQINRMKQLSGYNSSDFSGSMTVQDRINESNNLGSMLNIIKELENKDKK